MYYPSGENKGADQLRSYCEADLRLCFRLGKNPVFSRCGSYEKCKQHTHLTPKQINYNINTALERPVIYSKPVLRNSLPLPGHVLDLDTVIPDNTDYTQEDVQNKLK